MKPTAQDQFKTSRALRDLILEVPENELCEELSKCGLKSAALAARGRSVAERALANTREESAEIEDLHRGLGALIQMLRRQNKLSVEELASQARIDVAELRSIELDLSFDPNPRTIYQLEQHFGLPARCLVILSGAAHVESGVREEAVRFAASAKDIGNLSRGEKKLLYRFIKFLGECTDG